jgi:hypothetical protein
LAPGISTSEPFHASTGVVDWHGFLFADRGEFKRFLEGPVRDRLEDAENQQAFEADMLALASTGMAKESLRALLDSSPARETWEIGEAIAECFIKERYGVAWPWNAERDKRTPRASLPGADLLGLMEEDGKAYLALGEVKTTSDSRCPPQVMYGRTGMTHQIDNLASALAIHFAILKYLIARCRNTGHWSLFQRAAENYLASGGKAIRLFGSLIRDTRANEADLRSRGMAIAPRLSSPTKLRLIALYLPEPLDDLVDIVEGGAG